MKKEELISLPNLTWWTVFSVYTKASHMMKYSGLMLQTEHQFSLCTVAWGLHITPPRNECSLGGSCWEVKSHHHVKIWRHRKTSSHFIKKITEDATCYCTRMLTKLISYMEFVFYNHNFKKNFTCTPTLYYITISQNALSLIFLQHLRFVFKNKYTHIYLCKNLWYTQTLITIWACQWCKQEGCFWLPVHDAIMLVRIFYMSLSLQGMQSNTLDKILPIIKRIPANTHTI